MRPVAALFAGTLASAVTMAVPARADAWRASSAAMEEPSPSHVFGVTMGLRAGYALPAGDFAGGLSLSRVIKSAEPITLDVLYRLTPSLSVGAYGGYALGQGGRGFDEFDPSRGVSVSWSTQSAHIIRYGLQVRYSVGNAFVGYGMGIERLSSRGEGQGIQYNQPRQFPFEVLGQGLEIGHLLVGYNFIAVHDVVRLGVFFDGSLGKYSNSDLTIDGVEQGRGRFTVGQLRAVDAPGGTAWHQWYSIGVGGEYDL